MPVSGPSHLIFEREVGGVDCELTVTCKNADELPAEDARKVPLKQKADFELSPDQEHICDHATD